LHGHIGPSWLGRYSRNRGALTGRGRAQRVRPARCSGDFRWGPWAGSLGLAGVGRHVGGRLGAPWSGPDGMGSVVSTKTVAGSRRESPLPDRRDRAGSAYSIMWERRTGPRRVRRATALFDECLTLTRDREPGPPPRHSSTGGTWPASNRTMSGPRCSTERASASIARSGRRGGWPCRCGDSPG
jgi:hypothetical protein